MQNSSEFTGGRLGRRWLLATAAAAAVWPMRGFAQGAAKATDAQKPVSELYAALQAAMQMGSSGAGFQQRFARLAPAIDRAFNLDAILRTSVGLRWASLDEASRRDLANVFRTSPSPATRPISTAAAASFRCCRRPAPRAMI